MPDFHGDGREEQKAIFKEALKEWLDDKFLQFGRWSAAGIAAAGLCGVAYLILVSQGWHK